MRVAAVAEYYCSALHSAGNFPATKIAGNVQATGRADMRGKTTKGTA